MTAARSAGGFVGFDADGFLREYWQKKPKLIRNPWRNWTNPLDPDELAGLASEEEIKSRLIVVDEDRWKLEHGPVEGETFARQGTAPWTLLVQAVDHHVPAVAELIEPFRFIPDWRIDDVMVSYAVEGGGVGAHFDQYDVFLVQGLGKRRWEVGGMCDQTTPLLPHDDLRLLAEFEPLDEWVLGPGDMLYVPPGISHRGTAVGGDCMTYSIGFRAPSRAELIAGWSEAALDDLSDDDRFTDRLPFDQDNPGEIGEAALERLRAMVTERLSDRNAFARWFGEHATAAKDSQIDWRPDDAIDSGTARDAIAQGAALERNPAKRFAFIRTGADTLTLFVDGHAIDCAGPAVGFAERLCRDRILRLEPTDGDRAGVVDLIVELVNAGCAALDEAAN